MDTSNDLRQQAAYFVHHVSTPAATLQLNLQVLERYLPALVAQCQPSNKQSAEPPIAAEVLAALHGLTAHMQESVAAIQQRTREFANQLQQHNPQLQAAIESGSGIRYIERVLVVEDEEIHQQIALLQLAGHCHVDLASSGQEALLKWQSHRYDLVLMDFLLPGMSGKQLLQALAEVDGPAPLIVGFTDLPQSADEFYNTALPIAASIAKPFKLSSFEAVLGRLNLVLGEETRK